MKATYEFRVDGREIFVIDDFITGPRLTHLATYLDMAPAQRLEADRFDSGDTRLWIIPLERDDVEKQPYFKDVLREIAEHFPGESFTLQRTYCNAISFGDMLVPHRDTYDAHANHVTALLFACEVWEREWGAETIFFNEAGDAVYAVTPRPGRLVLFRSIIEHRAGTPSRNCNRTRLTLAFKLHGIPA